MLSGAPGETTKQVVGTSSSNGLLLNLSVAGAAGLLAYAQKTSPGTVQEILGVAGSVVSVVFDFTSSAIKLAVSSKALQQNGDGTPNSKDDDVLAEIERPQQVHESVDMKTTKTQEENTLEESKRSEARVEAMMSACIEQWEKTDMMVEAKTKHSALSLESTRSEGLRDERPLPILKQANGAEPFLSIDAPRSTNIEAATETKPSESFHESVDTKTTKLQEEKILEATKRDEATLRAMMGTRFELERKAAMTAEADRNDSALSPFNEGRRDERPVPILEQASETTTCTTIDALSSINDDEAAETKPLERVHEIVDTKTTELQEKRKWQANKREEATLRAMMATRFELEKKAAVVAQAESVGSTLSLDTTEPYSERQVPISEQIYQVEASPITDSETCVAASAPSLDAEHLQTGDSEEMISTFATEEAQRDEEESRRQAIEKMTEAAHRSLMKTRFDLEEKARMSAKLVSMPPEIESIHSEDYSLKGILTENKLAEPTNEVQGDEEESWLRAIDRKEEATLRSLMAARFDFDRKARGSSYAATLPPEIQAGTEIRASPVGNVAPMGDISKEKEWDGFIENIAVNEEEGKRRRIERKNEATLRSLMATRFDLEKKSQASMATDSSGESSGILKKISKEELDYDDEPNPKQLNDDHPKQNNGTLLDADGSSSKSKMNSGRNGTSGLLSAQGKPGCLDNAREQYSSGSDSSSMSSVGGPIRPWVSNAPSSFEDATGLQSASKVQYLKKKPLPMKPSELGSQFPWLKPVGLAASKVSLIDSFDAILQRSSTAREFIRADGRKNATVVPSKSDPYTIDKAFNCLDSARRAPSSFNVQPYKVILVHSREGKSQLASSMFQDEDARRVLDSDCTALFLADTESRQTMNQYETLVKKFSASADGDESRVQKKIWRMKWLISLFSSGSARPTFISAPMSFLIRFFISLTQFLFGRFFAVPTLCSPDTWAVKNTMPVAMAYMLGCNSRGLDTCAMQLYNANDIRRKFNVPPQYAIPLAIATGKTRGPSFPEPRFDAGKMLFQDIFGGRFADTDDEDRI